MSANSIRVLFLADTHLGFDLPAKPRVVRRRRGPEFFENFERALAPARSGDADLVIHGGALLYRSKVPAWLVEESMKPLRAVAELGVPVFVVPGNHERSRIPYPLLTRHPGIHLFDVPRTFRLRRGELTVAISGFPFRREIAGRAFSRVLEATRWAARKAQIRLLCMHQAIEGATVGVHDFTFRRGPDVLEGHNVPVGFAAVLSGHIHRAQVLESDLSGRSLDSPVIYAGATSRTAFAEREETKGYWLLDVAPSGQPGGRIVGREHVPLPSRPMEVLEIPVEDLDAEALETMLREAFTALDPDAIVRLKPKGSPTSSARKLLSAPDLRRLAPSTMNVDLVPERRRERRRTRSR